MPDRDPHDVLREVLEGLPKAERDVATALAALVSLTEALARLVAVLDNQRLTAGGNQPDR